jgi:hypothetical protein
VRPIRLVTGFAVPVAAVGAVLTGCANATPGQSSAQAACTAYANTGRHQVTTTVQATEALRAQARSAASSAAAADGRWATLQPDISAAYAQASTLAGVHNSGQTIDASGMQAYFDADQRVQRDCKSAGKDIGPLQP